MSTNITSTTTTTTTTTNFVENDPTTLLKSTTSFPITISLIVILHIVYIYQLYQQRRQKRQYHPHYFFLTNYHSLIIKKRFYKLIIAIFSHPSMNNYNYQNNDSYDENNHDHLQNNLIRALQQHESSRSATTTTTTRPTRLTVPFRISQSYIRYWIQRYVINKLLKNSGLLLLWYNCHVFWSCRLLEARTENYVATMIGLIIVAIALECYFSYCLLQHPLLHHLHVQIKKRTIGSTTVLSCALLMLYRYSFPKLYMTNLFFVKDPGMAHLIHMIILMVLSWSIHPGVSVVCGSLSGMAWSIHITSFLAQEASFILYIWIILLIGVSLKTSSSQQLSNLVPCIDHVGWNRNGQIVLQEIEESSLLQELLFQQQQQQNDNDDWSNSTMEDVMDQQQYETTGNNNHYNDVELGNHFSLRIPAEINDVNNHDNLALTNSTTTLVNNASNDNNAAHGTIRSRRQYVS